MVENLEINNGPIAISMIAGRYLLFDIDVVTYLRRAHNICGVLIGGIPQAPQQNVFLGLPIELLPEEALLLVEKEVAYIVDDSTWHQSKFSTFNGVERKAYLDSLRQQGRKAQKAAAKDAQRRAENGLVKQALKNSSKSKTAGIDADLENNPDSDLFASQDVISPRPSSQSSMRSGSAASTSIFTITPTTSYNSSLLPQSTTQQADPPVPRSFPLYAHLHARKYFLTPGLRFGCDYTVYPGDPLRFHSHFLAVGYDWDQEIPLMDLIGGGRLGTGVKKGFLIGGKDPSQHVERSGEGVRTFCIEWGGM